MILILKGLALHDHSVVEFWLDYRNRDGGEREETILESRLVDELSRTAEIRGPIYATQACKATLILS